MLVQGFHQADALLFWFYFSCEMIIFVFFSRRALNHFALILAKSHCPEDGVTPKTVARSKQRWAKLMSCIQ